MEKLSKQKKQILIILALIVAALCLILAVVWQPRAGTKLEEIQKRGVLKVGTAGDYQPLSYLEPETGKYVGFDAELAEDLAGALGVELEFVETSWPTLMDDTLSGKFDLAICGIAINDTRKEQALMSDGYLENGKTLLCRAEDASKYTNLESINRPEVRVMENPGGTNEKFARENLPDANLIIHDVNQEIPGLVASGEADVMITEIVEAGYYVDMDDRLAAPLIHEPFTQGQIGALMPKGSEDLLDFVNEFLAKEKDSGRIDELSEEYIYKYLKPDEPQSETAAYAELIFDNTRVHTIDVSMSEDDRADQLANPKEKTKYKVTVVIDGEEIKDVSFNTKGNSSLFFVADAGKDKFSYGINFGKYVDGQTFHGLDKLSLQNNCSDGSSMKESMAYWLFSKMGVDSPLSSYVWLTVNGEVQGLYTALEGVEDSFLDRTSAGEGTIYKPEDGDMGLTDEEMERIKGGDSAAHNNGNGADLAYKDDNEESYPDIFSNAETADDSETRARVIKALKALSEKIELDKYLDIEEIIRYFAVHNYLVAYDSYTGPMLHNYLLYENNGRLSMLPWDYDIAFGSFPANAQLDSEIDSNAVINTGIDSPLGLIADEARPMWNWILSGESYLNEYHADLSELVSIIDSGEFEAESARIHDLIIPFIEKDPKAFFTSDKYNKAYETLLAFAKLRADSVSRQVNGQLATRSELQKEEDKVDASAISIKDMGSITDLS